MTKTLASLMVAGVAALGLAPKADASPMGSVNLPVVCAGTAVAPGDVVVADDDGVVIVPAREAAEVAAKGNKRRSDEEDKRRRLAAGELGLDMYKMREPLAKAGLVYVDKIDDVP